MLKCPSCNASLTENAQQVGQCQECGVVLRANDPQTPSLDKTIAADADSQTSQDNSQTVDLPSDGNSSWQGTESTAIEPPDNSETVDIPLPDTDKEATTTTPSLNKTESDPSQEESAQTIDLPPGEQSWAGQMDGDSSQTIDLPPDGSSSWQEGVSEDNSQTVDLPVGGDTKPTIGDTARTIDLPASEEDSGSIGDSSQTIDLSSDGTPSWKEGSVGDSSQTIDLPDSAEGAGSIGDSSLTVDIPSGEQQPARKAQPAPKTITGGPAPKTMIGGFDDVGEDLSSAWGGTLVGDQPSQTIRVDSTIASVGGSSIVVKSRALVKMEKDALPDPGADYELLDVLGEGGMGVVYSARQASVDRLVALKMLKGEHKLTEEQKDKFISEAVVTGDLDHPNIVPIYDLGANEQGALFYSMKKVQGTPWMKVIGTNTLEENLEILMKVADAVSFAHEAGVVHRDLKPENVMLGKHGEVLVMDWGLALATEAFRAIGSITQTTSMGGTPAYMSPEMATGPVDRVTHLSDIYLLGGILYEIVTGLLPHTGKTVLVCLKNASKNILQPTEKSGELVDVAIKAMSTQPEDRYQSVEEFQKAIREYRSHWESIRLSDEADRQLTKARETDDYRDYADAMYGFENAVKLWSGNSRAIKMESESKLAYAECAFHNEDYELGLSVLDPNDPNHTDMTGTIDEARRDRDARRNRLRTLRYVSAALVGVVLLVVSAAFFLVKGQKDRAEVAEKKAVTEKDRAVAAEADAKNERDQAETARAQAVAATEVAKSERQRAETEKDRADIQRDKALAAQQAAEAARRAEQYEAYVAQIGLAAARIKENSFDSAVSILNGADEEFRNWEWGRLAFLCQQSVAEFQATGPMDAVAFGPSGQQLATGSWDGQARIWDARSGELRQTIPHGRYVHAVAFSPSGTALAIGSSDPVIKLVNPTDGQTIREFPGHEASVLSLAFSPDGQQLLSTSYDKTARLWDVSSGKLIQQLQGHNWWVWSAAFSPDASRIVTTSQDGKAIVWQKPASPANASYIRLTEFSAHGGPVYAAAFSPDGKEIATGGFDKRVLVWNPDEVAPVDLQKRVDKIAAAPPKYRALEGHTGSVRAVNFAPTGKLIVSGAQDNTVRVWDAESGALIKALRGHGGQVRSCVFAPTGTTVASASHDNRAKLWNLDGYEEVRVLRGRVLAGHADAVLAASFSPDGKKVVTASRDRTARTWDVNSGKELKKYSEGHEFLATAARFTPNGQSLITAGGDNTVRVWDVSTGTQRSHFDRTGRSSAVAVSHDGSLVLTGGDDRTAKLWDLASGQMIQQLVPAGTGADPLPMEDRSDVTAVAFSGDDRTLVVGDTNGQAWLWKRDSLNNDWKEAAFLKGHGSTITAAAFTPSGDRVLTASGDHTVGQWDVSTGRERRELTLQLDEWVASLAVSSDGNTALTASADGKVQVWDINQATMLRSLPVGEVVTNYVDIAPNGKLAATVCAVDRTVRLWDLASGQELYAPDTTGSQPFLDGERLGGLIWSTAFSPSSDYLLSIGGNDARLWNLRTGQANMAFSPHGAVASASFSPDGSRIVTGSWDNSAKIWDVASGNSELKLFGSHSGFVNSAVFSPDGTKVLTASDDGTARLWNASTGKASNTVFTGHEGRIRSAVFSTDGSRVLTASNDKTARIWDANTARESKILSGHEWAVRCAVFSKDGSLILTGSEDSTARLWNAETGETTFELLGHSAPVTAVAISADGQRALTGSQDNTIKVWDATTGKEILTLTGHQQEVTAVGFSPTGHDVVSSSRDGSAIVWLAVDWQGDVQGVPVSTPVEPREAEPALPKFEPSTPTQPKSEPALPETKDPSTKESDPSIPALPEIPMKETEPTKAKVPEKTPAKEETPSKETQPAPELFPETKKPVDEPPAKTPSEEPSLPDLFPNDKPAEKPTEKPEPEMKKPESSSPLDLPLPPVPTKETEPAPAADLKQPMKETPETMPPANESLPDLFPENKPTKTPAEEAAPAKETKSKPELFPETKKPVEKTPEKEPSLPDLFPENKPAKTPADAKPPAKAIEEALPELPPDLFPGDKPAQQPEKPKTKSAPPELPKTPPAESIDDLFKEQPAGKQPSKPAETPPAETPTSKKTAPSDPAPSESLPDLFPDTKKPEMKQEEPPADLSIDLFPPDDKKSAKEESQPAEAAEKPQAKEKLPSKANEDPLPTLPPDLFPSEEKKPAAPKQPKEKVTNKADPAAEELPLPAAPAEKKPIMEELPALPELFPAGPDGAKKPEPKAKPAVKKAPASDPEETPPPKLFND